MISYFRLWRLLERRGYSRKDITWLAGISDSTYRKLLNSDSVRMDVLERICKALNVDIGDICSFRRECDYLIRQLISPDFCDHISKDYHTGKFIIIHTMTNQDKLWHREFCFNSDRKKEPESGPHRLDFSPNY